ncbi:MAG: hypothetical protein AAFU41_09385 [Pseudomonadota bacterium]
MRPAPPPSKPAERPSAFGAVGRAFDGIAIIFRALKYAYFGFLIIAFLLILLINGSLFL